ncbi:hypothetical protein G9A89_005820 [Geosiphon pyriformis]|nr:hypothetical protein G9A89_005820 [Geosiphon pyriformis]
MDSSGHSPRMESSISTVVESQSYETSIDSDNKDRTINRKRTLKGRARPGRMATCCFGIRLKPGVLAISTVCLLYSLAICILHFLYTAAYKSSKDNAYNYPIAIGHLFIALISIYGIFIVGFKETTFRLKMYSYLSYVIVFLLVTMNVTDIIIHSVYKDTFLEKCHGASINKQGNEIYMNEMSICKRAYNVTLPIWIVIKILGSILSIYFSFVITSYVARRQKLETMYDPDIESIKDLGMNEY